MRRTVSTQHPPGFPRGPRVKSTEVGALQRVGHPNKPVHEGSRCLRRAGVCRLFRAAVCLLSDFCRVNFCFPTLQTKISVDICPQSQSFLEGLRQSVLDIS